MAASWWLLLSEFFPPRTCRWSIPLGLFFLVWAIYLADRLMDPATSRSDPSAPVRKRFAGEHPLLMRFLLGFALTGAAITALFLPPVLWVQSGIVAALTGCYFFFFRRLEKPAPLPLKELLIGFCFAAGAGLPFEWPVEGAKVAALTGLGILCATNCLLISKAEKTYDAGSDPTAWFARPDRTFPFRTVWGAGILLATLALLAGLPFPVFICLITSTILLWIIDGHLEKVRNEVASLADLALWFPAVSVLVYRSISS